MWDDYDEWDDVRAEDFKPTIMVEIQVHVVDETEKALAFLRDDLEKVWLPKSQVTIILEQGTLLKLEVPEWLIFQKELEDDSCLL